MNSIISISSDEEYIEEEGNYIMSNERNEGKLRDVS